MANDWDVEKFIQAVRLRAPLWNKNDPMHRNLEMTNSLWNEVVDEMGGNLTVAELKQKWHNLRDCFRREMRTVEAGKKKRRWIYYNQMLFLLHPDFMTQKDGKSNFRRVLVQDAYRALFPIKIEPPDDIVQIDLTQPDSNNSDFIETENISHEIEGNSLSQNTQRVVENGEPAIPPALGDAGERGRENGILINRNTRTWESSRHQKSPSENDDYHFAMSIIPHMRQVPAHRKLRMRIRISEIIAQESGYTEAPT